MAAAPNRSGQLQNEALNRPRFNLGFFVPTRTKCLCLIGSRVCISAARLRHVTDSEIGVAGAVLRRGGWFAPGLSHSSAESLH